MERHTMFIDVVRFDNNMMSILLKFKFKCRFHTFLNKIYTGFFMKLDKIILSPHMY